VRNEKLGSNMAAAVSGLDLNHLPDPGTQGALTKVLHGNLVLSTATFGGRATS
jgi:hypothetical protein